MGPQSDRGEPDATSRADDDPVVVAPVWLESIPLVAATLVAAVGSIGLLFAILGSYRLWVVLPLGVAAAIGLLVACRPLLKPRRSPRSHQIAAVCALVIAVASFLFIAYRPSQHVLINRDPGSYVTTAVWLDREGDLRVERADTPFADVNFALEAAVYGEPGSVAYFQFNHLTSVILAVGYGFFGQEVMFRLPALAMAVGLLALYAVAMRATRRPYASLVAPAVFAVALPYIYVARDTFSETFVFLLLWTALMLLVALHREPRPWMAFATGIVLGATTATRVDALVYVAVLIPLVVLSIATGETRRRTYAALALAGGALPLAILGFVDLTERAHGYYSDLSSQILLLRLGVVGVTVLSLGGLALSRVEKIREVFVAHRAQIAFISAGVVGLGLLAGWGLRPHIQEAHQDQVWGIVEGLQAQEGEPVEGTRTYDEFSLTWMSWYLGVAGLAAAIVGVTATTYRLIRGTATAAAVAVLSVVLLAGGMYWYKPSITPDQLWATRRFVPAVIPGLIVMATIAVASIVDLRAVDRMARRVVAVAAAALLVVSAAAVSWPVREHRDQYGFLGAVESLCDELGDDRAVLVFRGDRSPRLPQTIRSFCDMPVAHVAVETPPERGRRTGRRVGPKTAANWWWWG